MRTPVQVTPLDLARRFLGVKEVVGVVHNPQVVAMLSLVNPSVRDDETPWCSAFVNYICWLLALPRSNSLAARSWLRVGKAVPVSLAQPGFHVAVLTRGAGIQPGVEVLSAPGHVGFVDSIDRDFITLLGGNQGNAVSLARFPRERILGIREI